VRASLHRDLDYFKDLLKQYQPLYPDNTFVKSLAEKIRKTEAYLEKQEQQN